MPSDAETHESARQPMLRTERLELVLFATEHVPFLHHRLWTDPAVRCFLWDGRIISHDEAVAVVDSSLNSFRQHGVGMWLLRLAGGGTPIGFCGLRRFGEPPEDVELLYGLLPSFWGGGLATEASRAVLGYAFRSGLQRVYAGADPPNTASIRVMQRLGMRYDCNRFIDGRDAAYYSIAAGDG